MPVALGLGWGRLYLLLAFDLQKQKSLRWNRCPQLEDIDGPNLKPRATGISQVPQYAIFSRINKNGEAVYEK